MIESTKCVPSTAHQQHAISRSRARCIGRPSPVSQGVLLLLELLKVIGKPPPPAEVVGGAEEGSWAQKTFCTVLYQTATGATQQRGRLDGLHALAGVEDGLLVGEDRCAIRSRMGTGGRGLAASQGLRGGLRSPLLDLDNKTSFTQEHHPPKSIIHARATWAGGTRRSAHHRARLHSSPPPRS